jgi:hypothetical protein
MKRTLLGLSAAVLVAALMGPWAVAQDAPGAANAPSTAGGPASRPGACLQNNRIWTWNVIDERTLIVTDLNSHPFLVQLGGGCVGLNNAILALRFNTWTDLGCLERGDRVSFRAPVLGRMTCFVREVEPYVPKEGERGYVQHNEGAEKR